MSESDTRTTEELAYLLWERQGRPQNRAAENWMEAEYLAHPPTLLQPPRDAEMEVDLRMRGLGPLTLENSTNNLAGAPNSRPAAGSKRGLLTWLSGVGLLIALGTAATIFHQRTHPAR